MSLKLDKNKKYLLACSFGPDSMALFGMLRKEGYKFEVAHVNYGLRKEAKDETENLKTYCETLGVKLYILRVKQMEQKGNLEAECRKIRYTFFAKVLKKAGLDAVLVAHNEDDVIETFIMQKNRKSLVKHYGIAAKTKLCDAIVIRPILDKPKADLLKYCEKNKIPFAIDNSNLTDEFERNKIRHNIVSKMGKEKRREMILDIDAKNRFIENRDTYLNTLDLHQVENLKPLDDEYLAVGLNIMIRRVDPVASVSMAMAQEIRKILNSRKPNVRFPISSTLVFEKSYDTCRFAGIASTNYSYLMKMPAQLDTPYFYADFRTDTSDRNVTVNDYPITIRRANPNDEIEIKNYKVEVRRLFIDWKVPLDLRDKWPVIVNCYGKVIYIPHYKKGFKRTAKLNFYVK